MHPRALSRPLLGILLVLALTQALVAKPGVKSWAVDDQGMARLAISQRQIFDEVGGRASVGVDVPGGLAVLSSDLTLPEEAGDIGGRAYVALKRQAISAVADFTYLPLQAKKIQLEVDHQSVEDTKRLRGVSRFSLSYPLSLEGVPAKVARYLARTSYDVVGRATWSHYTEATGALKVKIQDPELKRQKSDVESARIRVLNSGTVIAVHLQVVPDSMTARMLQDRDAIESGIPMGLKLIGLTSQVRLTGLRMNGKSLEADIEVNLYNVRETVARWQAQALEHFHQKGVDRRDVSAALSTMLEVKFPSIDVTVRSQGDHFEVDASLTASQLDKCILGYLLLKEVLEPSVVRERSQSEPLSVLVKNVDAVRTRRFRNMVAAVASSQDSGQCDYTFKLGFPGGRVSVNAELKYQGNLEAYAFASEKLRIPVIQQAYSLLRIRTTSKGLEGHGLYEAQGAWLDGAWALCVEAAKQGGTLQAVFPASGRPDLEEGRLLLQLQKSRVAGTGWLALTGVAGYLHALLSTTAASGFPEPVALDARYDADQEPGRILADLHLKGASPEAVVKALSEGLAKGRKPERVSQALAPPARSRPSVELPPALASEIEADRKALGVTPWVPTGEKPAAEEPRPSLLRGFVVSAVSILVLAGLALLVVRRRQGSEEGCLAVAPPGQPAVEPPLVPETGGGTSPMRLRVLAGAAVGHLLPLPEHDVEMGRDEVTGVRGGRIGIAEPTISRVQARLTYHPMSREFTLHHVPAATNPTYVDEKAVTNQVLKAGDTIQIGRLVLRFEHEAAERR